jgi:hypothetical protein
MNRCGNCWQYGHNKRTCPKITEQWQVRYDEALKDKHQLGIDHWGERIANRTGTDPRSGAKVNRRSGIVRRCSYCKYAHGSYSDEGIGHTRVTCEQLKKDRAAASKQNGILRKKVVAALKREGIGVGAVISYSSYGYYPDSNGDQTYESRSYPYMVVSINWDHITDQHRNPSALNMSRLDQVCKVGRENRQVFPLPLLYEEDDKTSVRTSSDDKVGSWDLEGDPEGFDARALVSKAPANGWDKIPADYYRGFSRVTNSLFDAKKH